MARSTHNNYMKATVWTPTMRSDVEGSPDSVIPMAFCALDTHSRRARLIAELQRIDAEMTKREEAEKAAGA